MSDAVIRTDGLTKTYGRSSRGIVDLSLDVRRGEVFGFLGPNGAGKTTAIRVLLGLLHPTSGRASVFGLDVTAGSRAIRARLGNVADDFAYDERLTGRELLRLAAALRGADGLGRADELASRFGADLSRRLGELSRGNRQKIGLVQALAHSPELLVMDEPTGGLDPLMRAEFLEVVGEERARGATVFLSSHDLDEVQHVCDRVAIIREGRLVAVEDVEVMRRRAYRKVSVRLGSPVDPASLEGVEGVDGVEVEGAEARFRAHGDLDAVVKALARLEVCDIEITRPTLDELFLTFYRGEA